MTTAVVVLGAGASADFGVPTLKEMFGDPHAQEYLLEVNRPLRSMLENIFWAPRGYGLATAANSLTVEQMLTILKDIEVNRDQVGSLLPSATRLVRRGLYSLIKKSIFDDRNSRPAHLNGIIDHLGERFDSVVWASFNWDCIFESSFWYRVPWGMGYGSRSNPQLTSPMMNWVNGGPKHRLLKLHGGINWWRVRGQIVYKKFTKNSELDDAWSRFESNRTDEPHPVILEPSSYKYGGDVFNLLKPQWRVFLNSLVEADVVIVVGYSLPDFDEWARSNMSASFQRNSRAKWLIVDPSQLVIDHYQQLFGIKRVSYAKMTLAEFDADLSNNLATGLPETVLA
ncbi:MAG: hypothetical protein IH867_13765 [Chloroflexi bacterium]|nr:hypothetical protein [Chloroflexota bacterium]